MANVMLKYLKFAQILNGRVSFRILKHYQGQYLYRSYTNSRHSKSYATAAYKLSLNDDTGVKNNNIVTSIKGTDIQFIDASLAKIDSLIRRNGRTQLKNIRKVFSSIDSKEATSSMHGLYLLRGCKYCIDEPPQKRIEMVNKIWNKYQELGIEFDVRHYNAMLDVHVTNRLDFNPVEILASMEDLKIEPNKNTYMLIMKKYCQDGNISGASEILEYMKEKQMAADETVFNYLIEAYVNNNDIAGAKEMVEVMRSSNLEPTADTYAILACGYAAAGDKEEMMSHLEKCKDGDSAQNYFKVIESLASSGHHQHIDDVLFSIENKERYQQEFINAAVELIHKNYPEVAYKLAVASHNPFYNEGVNIFIKQLIKVQKEPSEVLHFCERIRKEGLNPNIFIVAARASTEYTNLNHTVELFKKIEKLGFFIRPSTFWPSLLSLKEEVSAEGWWRILKCMSDVGVPCDFKTYTDVLYPTLGLPKPDEVLQGIKQSGQALDCAVDALFVYYCSIGELDYALELTEKCPISVSNKFDVENFVRLYEDTSFENIPKYLKVLKYIFAEEKRFGIRNDVQGKLLAELILYKSRLLENFLNKFQDLTFSDYTLNICRQELNVRNPSKLTYLKKIQALLAQRGNISKQENLTVEDEDKYISHLRAENISCKSFLTQRIQYHIKNKNITRVNQLLLIFHELNLEYTPLMFSNLFGLWCMASDIDKAKDVLNKLQTNFPDFQVDFPKALDYVSLLMKYEKFDESYEALKNFLEKPLVYSTKDVLVRCIGRFNTVLSNTQNIEFVKKMQGLMLQLSKELGTKKYLLDPSINVHLLRGDFASALQEFRNIVVNHRIPASLNMFLRKCINANEKDILQQVVDLTMSCAGKSYALLELAVAFIESYNVQNAAKVIEDLGAETDPKVLDNLFAKLLQQNKFDQLETLLHITKPLSHIDREGLYCHVLRACASKNDFKKAINLFEKMKEEDIEPQENTMKLLQDLLKKNNQPLPLSSISKSPSEISPLAIEATKPFLQHLEAGDIEAALKELSNLKKGYIRTLPIKSLTDLVDLCLQKNCTRDLSLNVHTMTYIFDNVKDVLKPILEKYAEAGDVDKFNLIMTFMPDFSLINIGFNSYFGRAFIASGKYEDLLSQMEERVAQKNKLFSSIAFEGLLKLPEYEERCYNLAVKYIDYNYNLPIGVVWAHNFTKENFEKAYEIYQKYPISVEKVDNIILRNVKQKENIDLAKKYVEFVKEVNLRARVKERAYGAAVDLLVFKGLYDEAADLVVDSERQQLQLHKYYLSTLVTLKSILEKENKPVLFSIPLDTASGSSSDSE